MNDYFAGRGVDIMTQKSELHRDTTALIYGHGRSSVTKYLDKIPKKLPTWWNSFEYFDNVVRVNILSTFGSHSRIFITALISLLQVPGICVILYIGWYMRRLVLARGRDVSINGQLV